MMICCRRQWSTWSLLVGRKAFSIYDPKQLMHKILSRRFFVFAISAVTETRGHFLHSLWMKFRLGASLQNTDKDLTPQRCSSIIYCRDGAREAWQSFNRHYSRAQYSCVKSKEKLQCLLMIVRSVENWFVIGLGLENDLTA